MVTERKTIEIVLTNNDHVKLLVQILFFCNVDMKLRYWENDPRALVRSISYAIAYSLSPSRSLPSPVAVGLP